jgi:hypothetical protein
LDTHVMSIHADFALAMRPKEVSDRLQLEKIAKDHVWKVEPSCATTGEGIFEGLVCLTAPDRDTKTNMTPGMALQQRQATRRQQISLTSPSSTDMTACAYSLASCIYPAPHSNAPPLQPYCLLILATTYAGSSFASSTSSISTRLSMCGSRYPSQIVYTVTLVYHVDLLLGGVSALCSARLWVVLFLDDYMHMYELLTLILVVSVLPSLSGQTEGTRVMLPSSRRHDGLASQLYLSVPTSTNSRSSRLIAS